MNRKFWLILLLLLLMNSARAASIDCTRPTTTIDHAICQHETTVHIDADLAALFQRVQTGYLQPLRASLIRGQRHWLTMRGEACLAQGYRAVTARSDDDGLEKCLMSVYQERQRELQDLLDLQSVAGHAGSTIDVEAILDDPSVLGTHRDGMYPGGDYRKAPRTPQTCRELFTLAAGAWSYGDDTIGMNRSGSAFSACSFAILTAQNFAGTTHHEDGIDFSDVLRYSTDFRCMALGCEDPHTGTRGPFYRKGVVTTFGQEIAGRRLKLEKRDLPSWGDTDVDNVLIVGQHSFYIDGMDYAYEMSAPGDYTGRGRREVLMSMHAHANPGTMSVSGILVASYDPATGAIRPEWLDQSHPLRVVPETQ
jgi:uncharacterized protein YecT (DUF1311 family)